MTDPALPAADVQVLRGQIRVFFAFDIGYEVSLKEVGRLLASSPKEPLSRKKQTPNYMQYTQRPQVFSLGDAPAFFGWTGEIEATIFDFGAVSLAYRWTLPQQEEGRRLVDIPDLSQKIYNLNLEAHARSQIRDLAYRIRPAVSRPELSDLVEDYYVFILERLSEPLKAKSLLESHSAALAQILQCDTEPLSQAQQSQALSSVISYYERDMVLIDWNVSIIYDADYADTLHVLELLNVELLEARYMDSQLDQRIAHCATLSQKQPDWVMPLSIPYRQALNELAELRIESAVLAERVDNALKLIGDLYLARVYSAVSEQFHMPAWDASISRKLDIIGDMYQLLTDRVNSHQAQMLEIIIIVLILIEILLSLLHR